MKKFLSVLLSLLMIFSLSVFAFSANAQQEKPFDNSSFYSVGDYTVHYRTYEPSLIAVKQVMLLHGFGLSSASFESLAKEYVKKGFRVVLVDLPNFGYSSRETAETELLSREDIVGSLIDNLGGKWVLGGHSMGGGIAINVAIQKTDKVTGLVLFSPQTSQSQSPITATLLRSSLMKTLFEMVIKYASRSDIIMRKMVELSFSDSEYAKSYDLTRISKPLQISGTGAGMAIMSSHAKGTDISKLSALKIPMVIIKTENDRVANADNLNALVNCGAENLKVLTFEKGGHMYMEYDSVNACEVTYKMILSSF